jgi:hypothetical protein
MQYGHWALYISDVGKQTESYVVHLPCAVHSTEVHVVRLPCPTVLGRVFDQGRRGVSCVYVGRYAWFMYLFWGLHSRFAM